MEVNMTDIFNIKDKVVAITGGAGILGSEMARSLAYKGAKIGVLDIDMSKAQTIAESINSKGGTAIAVEANVLKKDSLEQARDTVLSKFGKIDVLINGAGGNKKEATTGDDMKFFDIPEDAIRWVFDLNFIGTVMATQVFGKAMAQKGEGSIINISSMASIQPLTKVVSYSAAKAAINNFTQWMAVHFNQNYSKNIRVNAIAPGFFLTEQNRFLLLDEKTGKPTERGETIVSHTPMGRYGEPSELVGTIIWLISAASNFVNGVVVPIDGGFAAFSGV